MKSKHVQKRYKAEKKSSCAMCKGYKRGWQDKKTIGEIKKGISWDEQIKDL
jgi:hypothetical protein